MIVFGAWYRMIPGTGFKHKSAGQADLCLVDPKGFNMLRGRGKMYAEIQRELNVDRSKKVPGTERYQVPF